MSTVYLRFLLPDDDSDSPREPLLERLLARAGDEVREVDWRGRAFRIVAADAEPMPGVAAAALVGEQGPVDGISVFMATPVNCAATMTGVRLSHDGILALDAAEAAALAADYNRVFGGTGQRLIAGRSGALFCVFDRAIEATDHDPARLLGRDIGDFLPAGDDGRRLRGLMSEIEMWLFEHPVNQSRASGGAGIATGLWLWGGGRALQRLPALTGWTAGRDPLFGAWSGRAEFPPVGGPGVIVLRESPGTDAWRAAESRWIAPALAALAHRRIDRLILSAGDRRFSVGANARWRFWRRTRPWREFFT